MDRSTARATGVSIALHAVALASALLIRAHVPDGPGRPSIIDAALIFDSGEASLTSAPGPTDTPAAPQARPNGAAPTDSAPSSPERAADASLAEAAPPPAADSPGEPDPASAERAAVTDVDAEHVAAEPAAPALAAGAPAPDESSAAPPATAADHDATRSPAAAVSDSEPESAAESALAAITPATPPDAVARHTEPMPTREHAMLSKRFASWTGVFEPGEAEPRVAWKQHGQTYTAVFRQATAGDPTGVERIVVDVSTEHGGKRMSTQLTMTRLSFSSFAQFVDHWNPEVGIHDDEIDGRFHSNTEIKLVSTGSVSPVFHGKVTLAAHDIDTNSSWPFSSWPLDRHQIFPEGLETGVRRIMLPSRFLGMLNAAANGDANVQRFERDARIVFHEDGTYDWSYVRDGGGEERRAVTSPAHYLLGLEGATLRIKGTVRGKVLVYAADRIVIDNDVRYAHAHNSPDLDDYLGLVAENAVEVAEPEVTGLGDLKVDASIYARREFAVREFRSQPSGTLRIFGSLTAGSLTATEPRFATKIEFDPRLKNARAPSFPLTDRYELESWDGEWRVEDEANGASTSADAAVDEHSGAGDDARTAATAAR